MPSTKSQSNSRLQLPLTGRTHWVWIGFEFGVCWGFVTWDLVFATRRGKLPQEIKTANRGGAETARGLTWQVGQKPAQAALILVVAR
jgi:hypothetical protein